MRKTIFEFIKSKRLKWIDSLGNWKFSWNETDYRNLKKKNYSSYEHYVKHQRSKLPKIQNTFLPEYDEKYRKILIQRLKNTNQVKKGTSVLCLAARIGTEVKAFRDLGCFSVGIDLNPGSENEYVLQGDFHNLQFADHAVDTVFSNSIDHTINIDKFVSEIKKVLKKDGVFILEICKGIKEGYLPETYEVLAWDYASDIIDVLSKKGFKEIYKNEFNYPWPGYTVVLKLI